MSPIGGKTGGGGGGGAPGAPPALIPLGAFLPDQTKPVVQKINFSSVYDFWLTFELTNSETYQLYDAFE